MTKLSLCLLASLSFSLAACGKVVPLEAGDGGVSSDGNNTDGGDTADGSVEKLPCEGPVAFEDLTTCLVEAQCELFVRCTSLFPTVEECIEVLPTVFTEFEFQMQIFGFGIEAGKLNYDGDAAVACLASFADGTCSGASGSDEACDPVFRGETAATGSCFLDQECALFGSDCESEASSGCGDFECCPGSCVSPVAIGQSCNGSRCVPGAHCVQDALGAPTYTCQPGNLDSFCRNSFDCDPELFCNESDSRCVPTLPTSATCENSQQCSGDDRCISGNCSPVDTAGQACDGYCQGSLACFEGECVAIPGQGQDCTATRQCNSFTLECTGLPDSQTCEPKKGLGETCADHACQPGLFCESELPQPPTSPKCTPPLPIGSPCSDDSMCANSACEFNEQTESSFCTVPPNCYE